ncbi:lipoyl domain-containing protein [Massilia sp. METH4]|uniref:lipoyl domain-containing protein n=1 Tax=Massilia sp. METH4 TaxID=3123041 RepID=UPI0030D372D9
MTEARTEAMTEARLEGGVWDDVEEGTEALLQEWLVATGDEVAAGQPLAIAELVKTTHEVTAPVAGRVTALLVAAGETFGRAQPLARIGD